MYLMIGLSGTAIQRNGLILPLLRLLLNINSILAYSPEPGVFLVHDLRVLFEKELISKQRWPEFSVQLANYKRIGQLEFFDLTLGEQGYFMSNPLVRYLQEPDHSLGFLGRHPRKRPQNEFSCWQSFRSWICSMRRDKPSSPEIEPLLEDGRCQYEIVDTEHEDL